MASTSDWEITPVTGGFSVRCPACGYEHILDYVHLQPGDDLQITDASCACTPDIKRSGVYHSGKIMTDRCKLDDCRKAPLFYLAYGCMNQHVADTTVCRDHLKLVKELVVRNRWHCGECAQPVVSGMYRLINPRTQNIITRKLDGTVVKTVPNPDYEDVSVTAAAFAVKMKKIGESIQQQSRQVKDLEGKCPCPLGHLGRHKFSCDKAVGGEKWIDNLAALPKKRNLTDQVTQRDWEDLYYGGL